MKTFILKRVSHTEEATFGVLMYQSVPFCLTLELPWRDNKRNVSCIPEGTYAVTKNPDKQAFNILSVPSRSGVQIHIGNKPSEIKGCVLLGEKYEPLGDEYAVHESRKAFNELETKLGEDDEKFLLKIVAPQRSEYLTH